MQELALRDVPVSWSGGPRPDARLWVVLRHDDRRAAAGGDLGASLDYANLAALLAFLARHGGFRDVGEALRAYAAFFQAYPLWGHGGLRVAGLRWGLACPAAAGGTWAWEDAWAPGAAHRPAPRHAVLHHGPGVTLGLCRATAPARRLLAEGWREARVHVVRGGLGPTVTPGVTAGEAWRTGEAWDVAAGSVFAYAAFPAVPGACPPKCLVAPIGKKR